jgi:hypothetical protein
MLLLIMVLLLLFGGGRRLLRLLQIGDRRGHGDSGDGRAHRSGFVPGRRIALTLLGST